MINLIWVSDLYFWEIRIFVKLIFLRNWTFYFLIIKLFNYSEKLKIIILLKSKNFK